MSLEYNFDGLVGPTHNYAGLAYGDLASMQNAGTVSNPRLAALEGLAKMRMLMDLGVPQAVLPPQQRPNLQLLHTLGFDTLEAAQKFNPAVLSTVYSAASMWTANAATVSSSANTRDGRVHITPANLAYSLHRAQEAEFNYVLFKKIFDDEKLFAVHQPLPPEVDLADEGAANHNNFCTAYDQVGFEMYVYGRSTATKKFSGRQTQLASNAVAKTHDLKQAYLLVQQNPAAIDAGVFHNDVICVVNQNVMFYHNEAFADWHKHKAQIAKFLHDKVHFIEIDGKQLSLEQAVKTYIFNSQLVSLPDGSMALIAPLECKAPTTAKLLDAIVSADNPISTVKYVECRQSMQNGGGPACLRLRIVLNKTEQQACHQGIIMTPVLCTQLEAWVQRHYRDRLSAADFLDPQLITEVNGALEELTKILKLGSIYPFQCN